MPISPVNDRASYPHTQHPKPASQETNQRSSSTLASENSDNIDFSHSSSYSPTYNKPNANAGKTNESKFTPDNRSIRQMKNDLVRDMAKDNLAKQAGNFKTASGYAPKNTSSTVLNALKSAEATSEGKDYWSADATADRIFAFAKNLAGDDDEMFKTMKDAFLKGFSQASGAKKGNLPNISYETRDKVLAKFDEWEKEISAKKTDSSASTDSAKNSTATSNSSNTSNSSSTSKTNPTTTVMGRTYGAQTVPIYGQGKFTGYSGTPVKTEDTTNNTNSTTNNTANTEKDTAASTEKKSGNYIPYVGAGKYGQ